MSALSPSLFTNLNAVEGAEPARMDTTESTNAKDFLPISNPDDQTDSGRDDDRVQNMSGDNVQQQQQSVSFETIQHFD